MPWSSGSFTRTDGTRTGSNTWQQADAAGVNIVSDDHDTHDEDLAQGIANCVAKDGQNAPTADLPMAGYKHTNVDNATSRSHYAATGQVQDSAFTWGGTAGGTADALTIAPSPAITAYAAGQAFEFVAASDNTGAATLAVNGQAAKDITKNGTTALDAGDIAADQVVRVVYDGTRFQAINNIGNGYLLARTRTFTSSTTYTPTAGTRAIKVMVTGAGGGGGGAGSTGSGQQAEGGGGAGGSYCERLITSVPASATLTIGAGGSGGSGNSAGAAGGSSSYSDGTYTMTAPGGGGGTGGAPSSGTGLYAAGGTSTATGGDINTRGSEGGNGRLISGILIGANHGGGAAGPHGGGRATNRTLGDGRVGANYGGGGAGAGHGANSAGHTGGDGVSGIIVIEEYA